MSEVSKTVRDKVKQLYAMMATVTAQKAIDALAIDGNPMSASTWANHTEQYLIRAGADAARWTYNQPRIKP